MDAAQELAEAQAELSKLSTQVSLGFEGGFPRSLGQLVLPLMVQDNFVHKKLWDDKALG